MIIKPMALQNKLKIFKLFSIWAPTSGTEIKVTQKVLFQSKATKYHLEFLLALKNASFPLSFLLTV
jgi:hypothetical protein